MTVVSLLYFTAGYQKLFNQNFYATVTTKFTDLEAPVAQWVKHLTAYSTALQGFDPLSERIFFYPPSSNA